MARLTLFKKILVTTLLLSLLPLLSSSLILLFNLESITAGTSSGVILVITTILAGFSAWVLSRSITSPLIRLSDGARKLADGAPGHPVSVNSNDEIGELSRTFNYMADELQLQKKKLLATLEELEISRLDILAERNFKENVLESISDAIITFSSDGKLTYINGSGSKILGKSAEIGMHHSEILSGWNDLDRRIEYSLKEKKGYGWKPVTINSDADIACYDIGIFPIGEDAVRGLTVTMRDETEKEKLREEMIRLDRLASLGRLSAGIAHEVRNPLTGISLLLDDLHDRPAFNQEDREMLSKALSEIERVERLISSLLNYSSPMRGDFCVGDLTCVIADTMILMRKPAEIQGVTLEWVPEELPCFMFDPEKIKQALINIIKNALEALGAGGVLTITTGMQADNVLIAIHDNGPGIGEHDLSQIFEPFFTRKNTGTGLGLSITQRIIEEHKGSIEVESCKESGTTFRILLPVIEKL